MLTAIHRRGGLAALVVIGAALIAAIVLTDSSVGASAATRSHAARARIATTSPAPFSVLSRVPMAADSNNQIIREVAQHYSSLLPSQARELLTDAIGTMWLIPTADGQLCLGEAPAVRPADGLLMGIACGSVSQATSGGLVLTVQGQRVGLEPDGVASVQGVTVRNNTYRLP